MKPILNVNVFEKCMLDNHLSKSAFCKKCGISLSTLNKILSGNNAIRLTSLLRIHEKMGIALYDMVNDRKDFIVLPK